MGEIPFAPEGLQKKLDKIRPKDVQVEKRRGTEGSTSEKARDKTVRRPAGSPKSVRKKNDDLKQAEYLGDFFEKVVPARIAVEIVKDYKEKVEKGIAGIDKNKYDDPKEYKKAVREVSNKIAQGFKLFEEKIYERKKDFKVRRGEASIKEVDLENVFEGKNIKFVLKEGDVAEKEYKEMLRFQEFLPNSLPKIYDYMRLGSTGILIMEKIEDETLEQLFKESDINTLVKVRPKIFSDLGKIIAIMDNNNFIHGDLYRSNVLLSNEYDWKIIDFEFSWHNEGIKYINDKTFNVKQIGIDEISDKFKNESIKSDFYEGYLLSRNLKEDIRFISKEKLFNTTDTQNYVKDIIKMLKSISVPSEETRDYFTSLISEINRRLEELGEHEKETKTYKKRTDVLKDFKNGIENFLEKKTLAK